MFQSGFEPGTEVLDLSPDIGDIVGEDLGVAELGDWQGDLEGGRFGEFRLYFEGGTQAEREVAIGVDPDDPDNAVLEYWLRSPNVLIEDDDDTPCNGFGAGTEDRKARIQAVLRNNEGLRRIEYRVRARLDDGFGLLSGADQPITWLTLAEFWNNLPGEDYSFRVTLNVSKFDAAPNTALTWGLHGQTNDGQGWDDVWTHEAEGVPVPIGEWFALHVTLLEGDSSSGYVGIELDYGGETHTIIDRSVETHHPSDPAPDGFRDINPLKLYTSGPLVCGVAAQGSALVVRWDDFVIGASAG